MRDSEKSKEQLIRELEKLRARVAQLEKGSIGEREEKESRVGFEERLRVEHKQIEEELKKKSDELQLILDAVPALIYFKDNDGKILNMNKATASLATVPKEKLLKKTVFQLMPDTADKYHRDDMEVITSGKAKMNIEEQVELLDKKIWLKTDKLPMKDEDGNIIGLIGFSVDITERKMAEDALRQSEEKLRVMFDSMTDGVVVTDLNTIVVDVNKEALNLFGYRKDEVIGHNGLEILSLDQQDKAMQEMARSLEGTETSGMQEYSLLTRGGSRLDAEISVNKLSDVDGNPFGFVTVIRDVTERKKAEEVLKRSEQKYRLLFESSIDGKAIVDAETNEILLANETALKLFGFSSKTDLEGINIFDYIHPADKERIAASARNNAMFKEDSVSLGELRTLTKTGEEKWILVTGTLSDYEGRPAGLTSFIDITERKKAEDALRKSEEKYRDLVEKEKDVIFSVDALGFITSINPAVRNWGYTVDEVQGKNFIELIPEDWREKTAIELQNALLASGELMAETRVVHKSGEVLPIEYSAMIIKEGDQYAGVQGIVRDISERKKAEEALRQSEEKFRVLFESIPDGISVIDMKTGKLVDSNPAALRMFGFSRDEVIGQEAFNLIAEKDRAKAFDDIQNTLIKGQSTLSEWCLLGKGGKEYDCEATASVINDNAGAPAFMVNVVRDVTERKRIEKELDDYRNNLEKMVQERTSDLIKANKELKREVSERQRAEAELRASEEKLRLIFDSIGEGLVVTDLNGNVKDLNDDAVRLVGYDRKEEVIGRNCMEPIVEADRARAIEDMMRMVETGTGAPGEYRFVKRGGEEFDGELRGAVLRDEYGNPAELIGVFRDITERKRAEEALRESEQKYRTLFEDSQDAIIITTIEGGILDFNRSLAKLVGYSGEELLDLNARQLYINPDDREALQREIRSTGAVRDYAVKWVRKDGERLDVLMTLTARYGAGGDVTGYQGIVHDITERRKAEQALRESEARSRAILEAMPDLIFQMSRDGVFIGYKGPAEGLYMSPEQFVGKHVAEVMPSDIADLTVRSIKNALDTGRIQQYSYELNMEGEVRHFDARMAAINDEVALIIVRDITERRNMENALKISEEKLRGIFNSIKDAVVLTDLEFTILEVNDAALEMSGVESKEEIIGTKGYDLIAPDDMTRAMSTREEAVEGHPTPRAEYKIVNKVGKEMYVDVGVSMYEDPSARTAGFVAVLKDITEHRRMEDALRDSEEKLRVMFSSMADGVVVTDLEGKIIDLNEAQLRTFGFADKKEVLGKGGFDFIVERDRDRAFKEMIKVFEDGYNIGSTFTVADNKGKEIECELSTAMLHEAEGKASGFITVMRDVTERRRMEQALRDSEEKLRIIFESIGDGIIVTDLEGIITETNEAAAKLGGWSDKGQLVGMSGFDFVAEQERPKMVADMIKALREQRSINVEYSVKDKDDREYQSEVNVTLLRDAAGRPKGIVSVIRDITERKRMEQDLRDSEEMSRGMIESAATAVCIVKDGKFAYVSPMFAEMTGYSIDELIGNRSTDYIHQDDRDSVTREAVANLKGDNIAPHEYRLLRKDGSFIWILEKVASIQYKGERAAIGSLLDITRLKQVEEALRDSEEKLRIIFASLPDGVTVTDMNGRIVEENEAGIRMSGFASKDQVIGLNGFDFIASSDRDRALADLPRIFETGISGPLEYKMVNVDGNEYDGEIIAAMMRDKSGNPQGFITVIRDITERKRAREELQESQEMTRGMLESAATGIYLVQDGKFKYVNPLFTGISGYTLEELLDSDSMNYIHPDDRETTRAQVIENLKGISDRPHEFRFLRKDGQSTWILEKVASIEYKGRRAVIGSFMDISERKHIEEMLQQRSRELEQRTNQLLALQKITTSIQSTLDLKEIMQQVADGVVHNLGFDHALIIKVDEAANVSRGMVFATKYDASKVGDLQDIIGRRLTDIEIPQIRGYSQTVDNAMDGKATITRDFFEVSSTILSREESDVVAEMLGVKTVAVMPLFARDRHVGSILALTDREEIDNVLMEPLRILSDQAGVAVENADLYHGVSEYARRLSVITSLSKILGSSLDIKGVYRAFTEEVRKVMDFDRTSIAMVEGDRLRYFVVAEDIDTQLKDGADLPLSDSATGLVVKTKRTLIEPDFEQEMKFPIDHMYYRSGLRSAIRVPLFSKGEVFATFNLASRNPNAYGEREKEILEQISGSLTAAMENSRLFNQVKQHEAELLKAYEDLKSAQAYMLQAEKLRALGEMAGGVAHDFNNILAVVLGRTQLALEDVKDEKLKKDLQIIEQTAMDAATTVRRLQDFARVRVERNFEALDLKEVVESALQMAESRRVKLKEREGVTIDIESKLQELSPVEGDAAELREGLLNIIFNAMDAMPDGGKITLKATQTKKWVTLAISDTGIGMPEEVRKKIFEPFFTTRIHKGTGLGLSVTYGIIQRHRGDIWVESNEGVGSTFKIKLPVCEGVVCKKSAAGKTDIMKSISILMVDDNPEVAGILSLTLKRLGHKVVEANSGEAAINTFEVGNFDLVITDLGMPDMSGHEVAKIVKEIKPGTPVLVISGWGGQLNLDDMPEVDGVIAKPFSKDVLSEKIAALLSGEGARSGKVEKKAPKKGKTSKAGPKIDKTAGDKTGGKKPIKKADPEKRSQE
ncbi:MAG: PAS domain S-box protein [Dehalococcoidia bacterium]